MNQPINQIKEKSMKFKKSIYALSGIFLGIFVAGSVMAAAPSAKFAATWSTEPALASVAVVEDALVDTIVVDGSTGYTLATIKVPQDKELMVGISAEIGLVTYGAVKGKNGGSAAAIADSEAYVTVFAVPRDGGASVEAAPGQVMLTKRVQQLDATLGGVIQSCMVNCETTIDAVTGAAVTICDDIVIAEDCLVTDEEIGLLQDTTAAHHFNFVLPNLNQGLYDIKAVFTTGARAEVDICDAGEECSYDPEGTVSASAQASAVINKTMLTVQQVRAAKGTLQEVDILEL
jgi:hypothetical protein